MRRFAFVVEIAALYAFVCLMGWLFNDGAWSFPGQPLHPFLLVVAIEATQYGLRPALLASGLGLGLYLIGARGLGPSDSLPMLAIMATGILMGLAQESRNRQLREAGASWSAPVPNRTVCASASLCLTLPTKSSANEFWARSPPSALSPNWLGACPC